MSTTTALAVGAVLGVLLTFAVSACAVGLIFLVGRRHEVLDFGGAASTPRPRAHSPQSERTTR